MHLILPYSHNITSAVKVLKTNVLKSRQQKNAITAMGHFITLVSKTVMFGILMVLHGLFLQEDIGVAIW